MTRQTTTRNVAWLAALLAAVLLAGCAGGAAPATDNGEPTPVTLMLDWVPNTNHTGLYVAQEEGYFDEAGLDVEIIEPGEVYAEQAVAGGAADFGISFQEQMTINRADGGELVSLTAIIQHNTSGFASLAALGVETPADWEGLRYGSFSSPFEEPTLQELMTCAGADFSQLEVVDIGFADPLAMLDESQVDLVWIYEGWEGAQADQEGVDLDIVRMSDYLDCIPDYYTPILIASEETISERPEVVRAFVGAVAKGYEYAIDNPDAAADILLEAVPELDEATVRESQAWISSHYQADASQWGLQSEAVWADYSEWMAAHGIIAEPIDAAAAFTNEYLP